jgi:diguanylate cyclase (GGDEF)-like protein
LQIEQPSHEPYGAHPADAAWERINRLDWQLWLVAISLIVLLGAGVLSFMLPTAFWFAEDLIRKPNRVFYGLCILLGLTLAYLLQKRWSFGKLRNALLLERKQWEQQLLHSAFHDPLTNLPNRPLFLDQLRRCLARSKRHDDHRYAVLFIDLDRFKLLNDSMGHSAGDQALIEVGRILQKCLRSEDIVARLGGDEFAVLLDGFELDRNVFLVLERIQTTLLQPLLFEEKEVFVTASIGIALSSTGYDRAEDVIRDADTAMYNAKAQGSAKYAVFDSSMHAYAVNLLELETDLRRALERKELVLHYQPIVWLHTGQVAGLEALIRWRHPSRGLVSPAEFLPAADAAGLMVPITQWVLREVCRQAKAWQDEQPASWPMSVSLNLPARYLSGVAGASDIAAVISESGLPPGKIRLEITEDQMMDNLATVREALSEFSRLGTRVYIDDFGTGFSSLAYLSRFEVDALKIDQSFVRQLHSDERNAAIVRSIVSLGHSLAVDVIAEGIETEEQLAYLKALRCQLGQGYHFSKPVPADAIRASLAQWFPESRDKKGLAARLGAFELFSSVGDQAILEIAQTCEEATVPAGTVLMREGQVGDFAYLLEEGSVTVYKGECDPLAVLGSPAVVGEMALLNPERVRTASVRALSNLRVLKLPIIPGLSFMRRYPGLKQHLLQLAAERRSPGVPD